MTSERLLPVIIRVALAIGILFFFAVVAIAQTNTVNIIMRDACDPTTFNAAVGPGTCVAGEHGTTPFGLFIGELQTDHIVGAWRFNPLLNASGGTFSLVRLNLSAGQQLHLQNQGGEKHTFTRVKTFGGGTVPALNALSGNPVLAPECFQPESDTNVIVEAGKSQSGPTAGSSALPEETSKWECCIHPWMRMIVTVNEDDEDRQ
jgi:hypothetical protein